MGRRFLKLIWHGCLLCLVCLSAPNYRLCIYLYYQARGQLHIITHTQGIAGFRSANTLTANQSANLDLIQHVKVYAEDSLGFAATNNYRTVYNQHRQPILWALTLSRADSLVPYYWRFPMIGSVSYKGFFEKEKATREAYHYTAMGYDAEIRSVSAWSTLGWLSDPILSSMLNMPKGSLCNLIFHELFHSTYYAPGSVEDNENLATFIGDKATIQFLLNDSCGLAQYLDKKHDSALFWHYMATSTARLDSLYRSGPFDKLKKLKLLLAIADGIGRLPFKDPARFRGEKQDILLFKNAYFIGFNQYHSSQDSLEMAFNKIYHHNLRNMVKALKQKSGK